MGEWQYIDGAPLVPVEIINPFNDVASRQLALIDSDWCSMPKELWDELGFEQVGLLELGTPLGWVEVGFSWCNIRIADETIPVEVHYMYGYEILIGRNAMKHFVVTFNGKDGRIIIK
ncbi:MAG: hypothetical protein QMC85_02035 [Methanocellales archaeon]|nr:hypothetical protein [Methanocellales archaeon]